MRHSLLIVASHRFTSSKELLKGAALLVAKATGSTAALLPIWQEAVGPSIAKNAAPIALRGDVLIVQAASAQWADALRARAEEILARLAGDASIRKLEIYCDASPGRGER